MMGHYTIRACRIQPYPRSANKACHPAFGCVPFTHPGTFLLTAPVFRDENARVFPERCVASAVGKPYLSGACMPL